MDKQEAAAVARFVESALEQAFGGGGLTLLRRCSEVLTAPEPEVDDTPDA